jgi:hypothetical protein
MKPRKPKPLEPSLRDRLSVNFISAFEADFEAHGVSVIQQLRQKSPEKYAEIASRLIAATEPAGDDFRQCRSMEEISIALLKKVGCNEFEITDDMLKQALEANDRFIDRLQAICRAAQGQIQ